MMDCSYCGHGGGKGSNGRHDGCDQEWDRRHGAGMCVKCGQKSMSDKNHPWCTTCNVGFPYFGYLGYLENLP